MEESLAELLQASPGSRQVLPPAEGVETLREHAKQWGGRQADIFELESFVSNTLGFLEALARGNGAASTRAHPGGHRKEAGVN